MDRRSFLQGAAGAAVVTLLTSPSYAAPADNSIFEVFENKHNDYEIHPSYDGGNPYALFPKDPPIVLIPEEDKRTIIGVQKPRRVITRLFDKEDANKLLFELLYTAATMIVVFKGAHYDFVADQGPFGPLSGARDLGWNRFVCHPKSNPRVRQVVGPQAPIHVSEHMPENIVFGVEEPEKLGTCYWHGDRVALVLRDLDGVVGFTLF